MLNKDKCSDRMHISDRCIWVWNISLYSTKRQASINSPLPVRYFANEFILSETSEETIQEKPLIYVCVLIIRFALDFEWWKENINNEQQENK